MILFGQVDDVKLTSFLVSHDVYVTYIYDQGKVNGKHITSM